MTGEIKTSRRHKPFGIVLESLVQDTSLSSTARLLAVWLAIRPPGWVVHPEHAQRALGLGRDAYYSARRQLIQAGYVRAQQRRNRNGTHGQTEFEFDQEPILGVSAASGQSGCGETDSGAGADIPKTLNTNTTETTTTEQMCVVVQEELIWPDSLHEGLIPACMKCLEGLTQDQQQLLLDELAGQPAGKVKHPVRWLSALAKLFALGNFIPEEGVAVTRAREDRVRAAHQKAAALALRQLERSPERIAENKNIRERELAKLAALVPRGSSRKK